MKKEFKITQARPPHKSMDYDFLKEEGIRLIQQLSGDIWTDYNAHDPGVTILEQLCYAITELGYRTNFPIEEILFNKSQPQTKLDDNAFYPAGQILPTAAISLNDYRKLIIDQVEIDIAGEGRVRPLTNAWVEPVISHGIEGLFSILIQIDDDYLHEKAKIKEAVERCFFDNRNIGEDLLEVIVLEEYPISIEAEIDITTEAIPETVLANILFELEMAISPKIPRRGWEDLLAEGYPMEEIFEGPRPSYGFVREDQLPSLNLVVFKSKLEKAITGVEGVRRIRSLKVYKKNVLIEGDVISLEEEEHVFPVVDINQLKNAFRSPDTVSGSSILKPISFFQKNNKLNIDINQVEHILGGIWANLESRYPISFEVNTGDSTNKKPPKKIDSFSSINNLFPEVYGIGIRGLPSSSSAQRKAKTKQLKAFLLLFDQILADYLAQLSNVRQLFSTNSDVKHTYFSKAPIPIELESVSAQEILKMKMRFSADSWKGINRGLGKLSTSINAFLSKNEGGTLFKGRLRMSHIDLVEKQVKAQMAEQIREDVMRLSAEEFEERMYAVLEGLLNIFKERLKPIKETVSSLVETQFIPKLIEEQLIEEDQKKNLIKRISKKLDRLLGQMDIKEWRSLCLTSMYKLDASEHVQQAVNSLLSEIAVATLNDAFVKEKKQALSKELQELLQKGLMQNLVSFVLEFYTARKLESAVLSQAVLDLKEVKNDAKAWKQLVQKKVDTNKEASGIIEKYNQYVQQAEAALSAEEYLKTLQPASLSPFMLMSELTQVVYDDLVLEEITTRTKALDANGKLAMLRESLTEPSRAVPVGRLSGKDIRLLRDTQKFLQKDPFRFWADIQSLAYKDESFFKRRHKFVDHLLARFGEEFLSEPIQVLHNQKSESGEKLDETLLAAKLELLNEIDTLSSNKSKGFNYAEPPGLDNTSTLSRKIQLLLGLEKQAKGPMYEVIEKSQVKFKPNRIKGVSNQDILSEFLSVGHRTSTYTNETEEVADEKKAYKLYFHSALINEKIELYSSESYQKRTVFKDQLMAYVKRIQEKTETFYSIENILLRPVREDQHRYIFKATDDSKLLRSRWFQEEMINTFPMDLMAFSSKRSNYKVVGLNMEEIREKENRIASLKKEATGQGLEEEALLGTETLETGEFKVAILDQEGEEYVRSVESYASEEEALEAISAIEEEFRIVQESVSDSNHNLNDHITHKREKKLGFSQSKDVQNFFSFSIGLIFPSWNPRFTGKDFENVLHDILLQNIPAHLSAEVYWLDVRRMKKFERLYTSWLSLKRKYIQKKSDYELISGDYHQHKLADNGRPAEAASVKLGKKKDDVRTQMDQSCERLDRKSEELMSFLIAEKK